MASLDPAAEGVTSDPSTLAAVAEDQGDFEMEVGDPEEAEADLYEGHKNCKKDPTHAGFIPAPEFTEEHLPEPFRDDAVYRVIQSMAYLTVRLKVFHISEDRPKYYTGSTRPYPFAKFGGKRVMRMGSGLVSQAHVLNTSQGGEASDIDGDPGTSASSQSKEDLCPCHICKDSPNPEKTWGWVNIATSAHVLFDQSEVKDSIVELFYDDDATRKETVVILRGESIGYMNEYQDTTMLQCPTHDLNLLRDLENGCGYYCGDLHESTKRHAKTEETFAAVVSHPHGCSKKISLGRWINKIKLGDSISRHRTKYTYSSSTCPGSSGAPVIFAGGWGSDADEGYWRLYPYGAHADGGRQGYNRSGDAYIVPFQ